ncbi:MAG TPA: hypothetical protein VLA66_13460 [Thermoanaerobaculia bacterium]|nr:hypothetical protein [Thermoanaerobaculia bacterium]
MRGSLRAAFALLSVALIGVGIDFESILHLHADGRLELRAHELSLAEGAGPCERAPHWDRARAERHEACVACVASVTAIGRATGAVRLGATAPRGGRAVGPESFRPSGRRAAPSGGRSPPAPRSTLG